MKSDEELLQILRPIVAKVLECGEDEVSLETELRLEHIKPIAVALRKHDLALDIEVRRNDISSVQILIDTIIEE